MIKMMMRDAADIVIHINRSRELRSSASSASGITTFATRGIFFIDFTTHCGNRNEADEQDDDKRWDQPLGRLWTEACSIHLRFQVSERLQNPFQVRVENANTWRQKRGASKAISVPVSLVRVKARVTSLPGMTTDSMYLAAERSSFLAMSSSVDGP